MRQKKQQHSGMQSGKVRTMSSSRSSDRPSMTPMGGREFGNVDEPMQAELASGNEGLAEPVGSSQQTRSKRRAKKAA